MPHTQVRQDVVNEDNIFSFCLGIMEVCSVTERDERELLQFLSSGGAITKGDLLRTANHIMMLSE